MKRKLITIDDGSLVHLVVPGAPGLSHTATVLCHKIDPAIGAWVRAFDPSDEAPTCLLCIVGRSWFT